METSIFVLILLLSLISGVLIPRIDFKKIGFSRNFFVTLFFEVIILLIVSFGMFLMHATSSDPLVNFFPFVVVVFFGAGVSGFFGCFRLYPIALLVALVSWSLGEIFVNNNYLFLLFALLISVLGMAISFFMRQKTSS
ncbi:hypothetical protein CVU82_03605 [Candidatus Falkowbacteria bacterium HGW-Falkowbacteria-1]|uniref:Uncharacterized protein n=1 Tax=Candidatus Falkowbacteria bacterium HGW-Falkowbacteria-1 TaxID=2013768 RepID=A0A2N2E8P3_9BACT|nr:MAG: hypothetical protein CVU82_03605 [Candidatus Falkowbacteria bacterium HGW-Falkowbacteria-1]